MAVLLVSSLVLPMGTALAESIAAERGAVGGEVRPQAEARLHLARAPRLPDAPQELLPAALPAPPARSPQAACLAAARRAEEVHGLPHGLLVAIALSESGLHAHALNIGGRSYFPRDFATARALMLGAAPGRSIMAGCVQVNARVHARGADWPLDPVRSADWAGGLIRRWYTETGSWAEALRRWHGGSAASTRRVMCRVRAKLEVTAPGSQVLPDAGCSPTEMARIRRSGEALLEVAEAP
ncbi:transglycosylase [Siccirubricoccus sp. KC 17139]|uniref:Transglycosylase n=1 Tax=Siccirubricoccus soli TaxID=2899147 RepID=A0ABT1DC52_9PROT|nr:transglycosylase [Siccirubricoccus soli]MCO6419526.1 transglycosylase [Siccirubricoccus soli]MCP2685661.1 transglycosylase [Siccirubricoccus soli]